MKEIVSLVFCKDIFVYMSHLFDMYLEVLMWTVFDSPIVLLIDLL